MKFRLLPLSLVALVIVLVLASCSVPPLRDPNLLADTSLIDNEACTAPCWRGITPGETSWDDARTILEDDPTLENVTVETAEASAENPDAATAIYAIWQGRGGTAQCCQMISLDGETVDVIFLRTAPNVTVEQLIEAKGEPTYAVSTEYSGDQAIVNLIYPEIPIILYAFVAGPEAELLPTSEIIATVYLTPDDMEFLIQTSDLHTWDGYQAFSEYGQEAPFEVTPSITLTPVGTPPDAEATTESTDAAESTPEATEAAGS